MRLKEPIALHTGADTVSEGVDGVDRGVDGVDGVDGVEVDEGVSVDVVVPVLLGNETDTV